MVCGCVKINIKTKPHLGQKNNNREHETLNLRVVDPSPTHYVVGPRAVA